jgi:hypothetical protein
MPNKPEYKFTIAPRDRVRRFADEVARVLAAIGYEDALVTDESSIWDFGLEPDELRALGETLGLVITKGDYIVDIAERLRGVS